MCGGSKSNSESEESSEKMQGQAELISLQRKTSLIDTISQIQPFSGDSNSVELADFLYSFNQLATLFNWDEKEKSFALSLRLIGTAARIVKACRHASYEKILQTLKNRFQRETPPDVALTRFLSFKHKQGMPVQEFFDRAADFAQSALVIDGVPPDVAEKSKEAMLHSMLLNNLSPLIRKGVIARDPKTSQQVLKFALLEEKACMSVNPFYSMADDSHFNSQAQIPEQIFQTACAATPVRNTSMNNEISALKEQIGDLTKKFDALLTKQSQNSSAQVICQTCETPGHTSKTCPQNVRQNSYRNQNRNFHSQNRGQGNYRHQQNTRRDGSNYNRRSDNYQGNYQEQRENQNYSRDYRNRRNYYRDDYVDEVRRETQRNDNLNTHPEPNPVSTQHRSSRENENTVRQDVPISKIENSESGQLN